MDGDEIVGNFTVTDVSLNRYRFFSSEFGGDSPQERDEKRNSFAEILEKAVADVGGWTMTHQIKKPEIRSRDGVNSPIAVTEVEIGERTSQWVTDAENNYSRKLVARSLLDVYYLQTAVMKNGLLEAGKLENTLINLPKFGNSENEKGKYEFETRGICAYLEQPAAEEGTAANYPYQEIMADAFNGLEIKNADFQELNFGYAMVGISENVAEPAWVVIASDKKLAAELVDNILPELFLSVAKVNNEYAAAEKDLLKAKAVGKETEDYLTGTLPIKTPSLNKMEIHSEKLSELRTSLAVGISETRRHLKTIGINVGNARKLLDEPLLVEQKKRLEDLLISFLLLKQEQLEADIGRLETILIKSDYVNEKYKNITQIRLGYYGRALAILFGLVSSLGLLQLIKEFGDIPPGPRISILMVVLLIFLVAVFWSKIKKLFGRE